VAVLEKGHTPFSIPVYENILENVGIAAAGKRFEKISSDYFATVHEFSYLDMLFSTLNDLWELDEGSIQLGVGPLPA
jgi:hypothetical protein